MGRCTVENKVCVLVSWALMLICSAVERDDFLINTHLAWEQARNHCQGCFKDLVTVSADNNVVIANKVSHTSWIGLQKKNNTWSRWANGDPLTFQNWSPGTEALVTLNTSCVAMLTLGVWVERNCQESLPFICYEERFFGRVTVTTLNASSVALSWLAGPGNISHYRLEVRGSQSLTVKGTSSDLNGLMPGTSHSVKVVPIKCDQELNPAEISFSIIPNKVENLDVSMVTENSLSLVWTKPSGKVDFYWVEVDGRRIKSLLEDVQVEGLTPGCSYTIRVQSGVQDAKNLSAESTITAFTKPAEVAELRVSDNTNSFMLLTWKVEVGEATHFRVEAKSNQHMLFNETVSQTEARVRGLPSAIQVNLSVTALAGNNTGETVTILSYTVPGPVSNLTLLTNESSLMANWSPLVAEQSSFNVELQLRGNQVEVLQKLLESSVQFSGLKRGVSYTVSVSMVIGGLTGPSVEASIYTTPLPPSDIRVVSVDHDQITFTGTPPPDSEEFSYSLRISSDFRGYSHSETVRNMKSHTFSDLKSGTRYQLELRSVVNGVFSVPVYCLHSTVPDKIEVSLSMLCSSAQILLCDRRSTRDDVFKQLYALFDKEFGENIFWELEEQQSEN
ncbi:receptor-type tyrosine-protein phosphatase eta [Nelusetta ayraudi]|uniref:receptor-type tyrosine-protein phosphatase eta n=1 Tax=Nelusetta ayraudi TaxID=303726 RepID=UPI003F7166AC